MKRLLTLMLTLFAALLTLPAQADGANVSTACTITWSAPTTGGPVATYNVYTSTVVTASKVKAGSTATTTIKCADLVPVPAAGQNYVAVTAANIAGESVASATIPFFVMVPPGVPTAVQVLP